MRRVELANLTPETLDSALLRAALGRHGWHLSGGRQGLYDRWVNALEPQRKLLIPLDRSRPDYHELLEDAITTLAGSELAEASRVLQYLIAKPGDEIRFCKEVATVGGAVPWKLGEELHRSASAALRASAKASVERRPKFGNANYYIANEFMDAVLMGQTEVGSYVVTAYTPPERQFYEKETQRREVPLFDSAGAHSGREVVQVMRDVLSITREALDESARTRHLEPFDEAVQYGFSKEMATAIKGLVNQSDGAAVTIEWGAFVPADGVAAPTVMVREPESPSLQRSEVEFKPTDYPILQAVEERLGAPTEVEEVTVVGAVEVLTRQVGKVGVIVVNVRSGSPAKKLRAQLPPASYNKALEAHRREYPIRLTGRQERRGNYYWLSDVKELMVLVPDHAQWDFLVDLEDE